MTHADDPIAFELFRNAIFSIADEMALTIFRTTYSGVRKDNMDYSTAFCDRDGKLVAQGLTLPGHLGAVPTELEVVVARYRRRNASARHLRLQAALLQRRADRL
jgi:N-methylhydantoinase B